MTVVFLGILLAISTMLRALPVRRRGAVVLTPLECGFLRGGTAAAILVTLAAPGDDPFDRAVAEAGDPLTGRWGIARSRGVRRAAAGLRDRLIAAGLLAPTGHFAIARCSLAAVPVVAAVALVDEALDLAAIIGSAIAVGCALALWFAPRRTIAGARALRAERRRYERVTLAEPDATALAMLVALHGRPALDVLSQQPRPEEPETPPHRARNRRPTNLPSNPAG